MCDDARVLPIGIEFDFDTDCTVYKIHVSRRVLEDELGNMENLPGLVARSFHYLITKKGVKNMDGRYAGAATIASHPITAGQVCGAYPPASTERREYYVYTDTDGSLVVADEPPPPPRCRDEKCVPYIKTWSTPTELRAWADDLAERAEITITRIF